MKTIGYIRVSTPGQADNGVSLHVQEERIRAWAKANDAGAVLIHRDEGISGARSSNRPGLKAALAELGKGDALVVFSLSRLSRSLRDTLDLADALQQKGSDLVSLSEKLDTTGAAGKMVFRMLAVLSEFERDQVSDRTRAALACKRANGEKTGGDVPYGFRARAGRLSEHPKEQAIIKMILRWRKSGASLRDICGLLNNRKIRPRGTGVWHPTAVGRVIKRNASSEA